MEAKPFMINFLCEYWNTAWPERQAELDFCIRSNASQSYTGKVVLVVLAGVTVPDFGPKVEAIIVPDRTYGTIFKLASTCFPGELCIVCNTDIYFDPELPAQLAPGNYDREALVLSRWDVRKVGEPPVPFRTAGSYDAYVFKAPLLLPPEADFTPGVNGCDAALAHLMGQQRKILNPANVVRALHLHITGLRSYDGNYRLYRPYLVVYSPDGRP